MSTTTLIQPRAQGPAAHLHPFAMWRTLWRERHVIAQLGRRQVQARYRGSYLGALWPLLQPLLLMAVYTLVFSVLLPVQGAGGIREFVLQLFCGLTVFGVFSDTVQRAPTAVVANPSFVKKAVFPLAALPVADLWASTVCGAVNLAVLMTAALALQGTWHASALWFPVLVPPLLLLTAGIAWMVAALGVYVRDLAVSIGVIVTVLFFLTPVVYRLDQVPAQWQPLLRLNPLTELVEGARATLLAGAAPDFVALGCAYLVAWAAAWLGFAWFRVAQRGFADVL